MYIYTHCFLIPSCFCIQYALIMCCSTTCFASYVNKYVVSMCFHFMFCVYVLGGPSHLLPPEDSHVIVWCKKGLVLCPCCMFLLHYTGGGGGGGVPGGTLLPPPPPPPWIQFALLGLFSTSFIANYVVCTCPHFPLILVLSICLQPREYVFPTYTLLAHLPFFCPSAHACLSHK